MDDYGAEYEDIRAKLADHIRKKYDRVLPLDEMLSDRWKKSKLLGFGEGSNVYENVYIYGNPNVGKNVWIGPLAILDATGGLEIGNGCEIGCSVMIFTHSTHLRCVSEGKMRIIRKPVIIGDHSYIGSGTIILPGVKIGHKSIVGARSVVTKEILRFSVAMVTPAKIVGKVEFSKNQTKIKYFKGKKAEQI